MKNGNLWWGRPTMCEDQPEESRKESVVQTPPWEREPRIIEVVDNRIYFYSSIYREPILQLANKIESLAIQLHQEASIQQRDPACIMLHINSFGGSLLDGLSGMNSIMNTPVPVYTYIDGYCASAATFLSIAGTKRFMGRNAFVLIHQLSAMTWGKFEELKDDMSNFEKWMDTIKRVYSEFTSVPTKEIDGILKHDIWFSAEECLKYGIIDQIL